MNIRVGAYYLTSEPHRVVRIASTTIVRGGDLDNSPQKRYIGHIVELDGTDGLLVYHFNSEGVAFSASGFTSPFELVQEIITDSLFSAQGIFYAVVKNNPASNAGIVLHENFLFSSYNEALECAEESNKVLEVSAQPSLPLPLCVKNSVDLHRRMAD